MPPVFTAARPADAETVPVLAVPVLAGRTVPPGVTAELDIGFLQARGFEAKLGETLALLADDGGTVLAVGLGEQAKLDGEAFRKAGAAVARAASRATAVGVDLLAALPPTLPVAAAAQALAEGVVLAAYEFGTYKSSSLPSAIERVVVLAGAGADRRAVQAALDRGAVTAAAVCLARDLVNEPAGAVTPSRLAEVAAEVAERGDLDLTVWDEVDIENERLGALLGVSRGSAEPPRLIRLVYQPAGAAAAGAAKVPTVALVGKGITFDSGGLSLKTSDGMMTMKTDMSGGAAVIATLSALRSLDCPVRVIGIVPATENMPGGRAIKPGDVLKARNGKTIEVLNTDAEGRLILADGLSLAVEAEPDAIVDIATLTGAQVVALGRKIAGVMGTDKALVDAVTAAAERAGERAWPLPLPDEYRSQLDSEVADVKNIGNPGQAGTLIAGLFLREFVGERPWAHLDIAGPARAEADDLYIRKGATGFGVRTLIELVTGFGRRAG